MQWLCVTVCLWEASKEGKGEGGTWQYYCEPIFYQIVKQIEWHNNIPNRTLTSQRVDQGWMSAYGRCLKRGRQTGKLEWLALSKKEGSRSMCIMSSHIWVCAPVAWEYYSATSLLLFFALVTSMLTTTSLAVHVNRLWCHHQSARAAIISAYYIICLYCSLSLILLLRATS